MEELYTYTNYRNYLRDFYYERKKTLEGYSFAQFSTEAGIGSPNYLKLVMDGKRNLSQKSIGNFARGLGLTPGKARYFEYLVLFNQAADEDERTTYFRKMRMVKLKNRRERNLTDYEYEFLSKLHYNAVYELVLLTDFRPDPAWITQRLGGLLSEDEAKRTLDNLQRLGFLREKNERLVQSFRKLQTPDEEINLALRSFHKKVMELGMAALNQPLDEREFRGLTIAVNRDRLPQIKERLKRFVKELNDELSQERAPDSVYQLGLQFIPLTRSLPPPVLPKKS
ncbi:MAG: hypothetical protein A2284_12290 [Deltaproteobacteria bacterium RIFOXYA12_FULL_61_11]|nr:MAG: hypothetical protein A2284_12290 [Deltaproteobacteria bacterium RIFOXYA12_FULL_61_11]